MVSAVVVALLGLVVLEQVKSGLLEAKIRSSTNEEMNGRDAMKTLVEPMIQESVNIAADLVAAQQTGG